MSAIQQATVTQINTPGNSNYDPYYSNVSLLLPMNGANSSTSFVDASPNQKNVTANGNTQLSTTQSKFGGSSVYFDGNGDILSITGSQDFVLTNDFTIEGWVYIDSTMVSSRPDNLKIFIFVGWNTGNTPQFYVVGTTTTAGTGIGFYDGTNDFQVAVTVPKDQWVHLAFIRTGLSIYGFVNGTRYTISGSYSATIGTTATVVIAGNPNQSANYYSYLKGYIDDLRITKGVARYTSNFTVPAYANPLTGPQYDPFYDNVSLLLHCNGANASTNFIDNSGSPKTVTANGNAQISTTQWKFNGSSAYFDGVGDYLSVPASTDFALLSGNFTVEFWFKHNNPGDTTGSSFLCVGGPTGLWQILIRNNSIIINSTPDGVTYYSYTASVTLDTNWHHFAWTKESSTHRILYDGVIQSASGTTPTTTANNNLYIGANFNGGTTGANAYMDDIRITKGVARYTSNFTPPRVPFADSSINIDPYYDQTVLLLPMNGANASTSFIDSSKTAKIITSAGSAAISTAQNKFGGSSLLIDALTKYLSVPNSTDVDMGSSDFTIECWVYATTWGSESTIISKRANTGVDSPLIIYLSNGTINARLTNTGATAYTITGSALSTSTWHHIAYTRMGNNTYLYVNGTQVGSTLAVTGSVLVNTSVLTIGNEASYAVSPTVSTFYIDDLRITKGIARYTSNFTPPVRPNPTTGVQYDNYYDNVSLLLHMNGSNNGTSFVDSSLRAKTVTANGNAVTSTTQYKYGVSSAYFDGTGDLLSVPNSTDFDFGSGDFTIECWVYFTSLSAGQNLLGKYGAVSVSPFAVYFDSIQTRIGFFASSDGSSWNLLNNLIIVSSVTINTWYHIAITRSGNIYRTFNNGTIVSTSSSTPGTLVLNSENLTIGGGNPAASSPAYYFGYIDDLRITKGIARYTANFTPPTQAFPDRGPQTDPYYYNTSLLLHFDGTNASTNFVDNSPVIKSITPSGNAQISTSQWKFNGSSAYFDGNGDYLSIPPNVDFAFGTGNFTVEFFIYTVSNAVQMIYDTIQPAISGGGSSRFYIALVSDNKISVGPVTNILTSINSITLNNWNHVAVIRAGTTRTIYINGVASVSDTTSNDYSSNYCSIGFDRALNGTVALNGYLDELRVTKGVARYLNNFTPPQRPFPDQ